MLLELNKASLMDFRQELDARNVHLFDEFEYDDDVFYDELRRQVLQLTADDDEDVQLYDTKNSNMVTAQKHGPNIGPRGFSQERGHCSWSLREEGPLAPAWTLNSWQTGIGTGVFIPQVAQSRRKERTRRKKNERGRTYKRAEKMN